MNSNTNNGYEFLMDTLPLNIVIYRAVDNGEDFVFVDLNRRVEKMEKIVKSETVGKRLTEFFPRVKEFGLLDALRRVYATGEPEVLEPREYKDHRIQGWRKNDIRRLPNNDLLVSYEDYAASRAVELELIALGQIIDSSINEIYIFDKRSFLFTYLNHSALVNIGYTMDEMKQMSPSDIKPEYTHEEFVTMLKPLIAGEVKELIFETIHRRKDTTTYPVEARLQKICYDEIEYIAVIVLNITKRRQLEAEIQQKKDLYKKLVHELDETVRLQSARMIEQSRLAQMGEMLSMIAHQWRQPLASISAIASTLELDAMMDNYQKEFFAERLGSIGGLSQHLSSTINDFRDFFKPNKGCSAVTWESLVQSSLQIIESSLSQHEIGVKQFYEYTKPFETNVNEVRQVLLNIFKNAEDVLIENNVPNAMILIRSYRKDAQICLSIEDNGGGIPPEIMEKIFAPYFSTKEKKDGTGLGLYMSKMIIEEHCRGLLRVFNTQNGALFEIALPFEKEID